MLTGLLFATHDTSDRPDQLTATLPFGGVTLIEYQARLLIAAGASQIIILVSRLTPELLGAIARIGRRGVTVDAVRHATEAADKLHPLTRVLMLADGLITTERVVATLAHDGGDALLVMPQTDAGKGYERVGGTMAWAGIARLDPRRIAEVARLPRDYDPQSALLRVAEQARAMHVLLPPDAARQGHGIEHQRAALAERGRAVLAAIVSDRRGWFARWLVAPIARATLPLMVERHWPGAAVAGAGMLLGAAGSTGIMYGWLGGGLSAALLGCIVLSAAVALSGLRDEQGSKRAAHAAELAIPALAVLSLGTTVGVGRVDAALTLAGALITLGALAERAGPEPARRWWWGSPAAFLLAATLPTVFGWPRTGMALAAVYAAATLAAAVERLRRHA